MTMRFRICWILLAGLLICSMGCGKKTPVGKVTGKVTLDGFPFVGDIHIVSEAGGGGADVASVSDGAYTLTKAPLGPAKLYVLPRPMPGRTSGPPAPDKEGPPPRRQPGGLPPGVQLPPGVEPPKLPKDAPPLPDPMKRHQGAPEMPEALKRMLEFSNTVPEEYRRADTSPFSITVVEGENSLNLELKGGKGRPVPDPPPKKAP
jgi:hypothetical protein